jgi:hypothetical protein
VERGGEVHEEASGAKWQTVSYECAVEINNTDEHSAELCAVILRDALERFGSWCTAHKPYRTAIYHYPSSDPRRWTVALHRYVRREVV